MKKSDAEKCRETSSSRRKQAQLPCTVEGLSEPTRGLASGAGCHGLSDQGCSARTCAVWQRPQPPAIAARRPCHRAIGQLSPTTVDRSEPHDRRTAQLAEGGPRQTALQAKNRRGRCVRPACCRSSTHFALHASFNPRRRAGSAPVVQDERHGKARGFLPGQLADRLRLGSGIDLARGGHGEQGRAGQGRAGQGPETSDKPTPATGHVRI